MNNKMKTADNLHKALSKDVADFLYYNFEESELSHLKTTISKVGKNLRDFEIVIEGDSLSHLRDKLEDVGFVARLTNALDSKHDMTTIKREKWTDRIKLGILYTGLE